MGDLIKCCPGGDGVGCGSSQLRVRNGGMNYERADARYICRECGLEFDEPGERPAERAPSRNSLAARLEEMDPDVTGGCHV